VASKGRTSAKLKNFSEALESIDRTLEIDPDNISALIDKGNVLCNLGKFEEELDSYDKILNVEPNNVMALTKKGVVLGEIR
jgi:tetratricopeptide (TPR) repeat protein